MRDVIKKTQNDWYNIHEKINNFAALEDLFNLTKEEINKIINDIKFSTEEGILEHKKKTITILFNKLESLKYDSKGFEELKTLNKNLYFLILLILIQRLISKGSTNLQKRKLSEETFIAPELKDIIEDINDRIKREPEAKNKQEIKSILLNINIYKKELENMKNLIKNIPKDKRQNYLNNFKNKFDDITKSINNNYKILTEDAKKEYEKEITQNTFEKYNIETMTTFFLDQAKDLSYINSAIDFVLKDRYKVRDILMRLINKKDAILNIIDQEKLEYEKIAGSLQTAIHLSKAMGKEIIYNLEKQLSSRFL